MSKKLSIDLHAAVEDLKAELPSLRSLTSITKTKKDELTKLFDVIQDGVTEHVNTRRRGKKKHVTSGQGGKEGHQITAEWLDESGVKIWNHATQASQPFSSSRQKNKDELTVLAFLRLTAFRLIDASSDPHAYLARLLGIRAKTIQSLLGNHPYSDFCYWFCSTSAESGISRVEANQFVLAGELETGGAEDAQTLTSKVERWDSAERSEVGSALIAFWLARVDTAAYSDNDTLALNHMDETLQLMGTVQLGHNEYRLLASKCWAMGQKWMAESRKDDQGVHAAIEWLDLGLKIVENVANRGVAIPDWHLFRTSMLYKIASAYAKNAARDPSAAASGAAALDRLVETTDPKPKNLAVTHRAYILRLHLIRTSNASESEVRQAVEALIRNIPWVEETVIESICQFQTLIVQYPDTAIFAMQTMLDCALAAPQALSLIPRILYEGLLLIRNAPAAQRRTAIRNSNAFLEATANQNRYQIDDKAYVIACQSLLWNSGGKSEKDNNMGEAAQWYELAAHRVFGILGEGNLASCRRKAAMCYIRSGSFKVATELIRLCPTEEASTQYLRFYLAVKQGHDQAAIEATTAIASCPDLDSKQLVLMNTLASGAKSSSVYYKAMQTLLAVLKRADMQGDFGKQALSVIRDDLADKLVGYLQSAIELLSQNASQGPQQAKECTLLNYHASAYNAAVRGLNYLATKILSDLFYATVQLMRLYDDYAFERDADFAFIRTSAMFGTICGKMFELRDLKNSKDKSRLSQSLLDSIHDCRVALSDIRADHPRLATTSSMAAIVDICEVEILCEQGSWGNLNTTVQECMRESSSSGPSSAMGTAEAILNVCYGYEGCPTQIIFDILAYLVTSSHTTTSAEIVQYSRWIRSIIRLLFEQSTAVSDEQALRFALEAYNVIRTSTVRAAYPQEEIYWLYTNLYNHGINFNGPHQQHFCGLAIDIASTIPGNGDVDHTVGPTRPSEGALLRDFADRRRSQVDRQ
nr:uncharacterized protein CI109_005587 [Kwoniella shandongensis]KAA5525992.1 hypothetical protein CI109_005587 [Kwoniella shandongensis]